MPASKKSKKHVAALTKNKKIDHRYNVPQHVKKDGTHDVRTLTLLQLLSLRDKII